MRARIDELLGNRWLMLALRAAPVAIAIVIMIPFIGCTESSSDLKVANTPELYDATGPVSYEREIDSVLEQDKPVFLYFYTVGCPPCEEQKPAINELMRGYGERIAFMDVLFGDSNVAMEFNVQGVPTVLLITGKDSEGKYTVYQRFEGVTSIETLRDGIEQVLRLGE